MLQKRVLGQQAKYRTIMCVQSGSSDTCLWAENLHQHPLLSGCVGVVCIHRTSVNGLYSLAVRGVSLQRTSVNSLYSLAVWGVSVHTELPSTAFTLWLCGGCLYTQNFRQQPLLSGCVWGVCIHRTSINSLYSLAVCVCVGGVSAYRELQSTALWLCWGGGVSVYRELQSLLSGCARGVCIHRTSVNSLYFLDVWGQRVLGRQAKYRGIMCVQ